MWISNEHCPFARQMYRQRFGCRLYLHMSKLKQSPASFYWPDRSCSHVCPYVVLNNDTRRRLFRPCIVPRLKSNLFRCRRFKCIFHEVCNCPIPLRALDIDVCPEHFRQSRVIGNNLQILLHSSAVHNSVCDIINEGSPNNFVPYCIRICSYCLQNACDNKANACALWTIGNSSRGVALSTGCNACNTEHGD